MNLVVGEGQDLVITVKNNGTLSDKYSISVTTNRPELLAIKNGIQATETLDTSDVQQINVGLNILSSGEIVTAGIKVSSGTSQTPNKIEFNQQLIVRGGVKSLPDFDVFGILQIILIASVALVSFLFNRQRIL